MTLTNSMETTSNLITSIKKLGGTKTESHAIKDIIKTFLYTTDMAIKDNKSTHAPLKQTSSPYSERMKSISEAKQAFLNSTVESNEYPKHFNNDPPKEQTLHYAQIAITTDSEDPRSTGGGREKKIKTVVSDGRMDYIVPIAAPSILKKHDPPLRKVSFKVKSASISYRRPPIATKTGTSIINKRVSDLTKKFNELDIESQKVLEKTTESKKKNPIEKLTNLTRTSSNSSSPSSTVSTSPDSKILRNRRGSKRRNNKKRCSSFDSIDKMVSSDSSSTKVRVNRSKSDGTKISKSPKRRLKYSDNVSNPTKSEQNVMDENKNEPKKVIEVTTEVNKPTQIAVKNVIQKFECEIKAHSNTLPKKRPVNNSFIPPLKEKPKVPEKKATLCVTKNVVLEDGVPKLKPIKTADLVKTDVKIKEETLDISKKEPIYDKRKYKTSFINTTKLPLHAVEIIQEDASETSLTSLTEEKVLNNDSEKLHPNNNIVSKTFQDLSEKFTPNDSFLWRRKS